MVISFCLLLSTILFPFSSGLTTESLSPLSDGHYDDIDRDFLAACSGHVGPDRCSSSESDRLQLIKYQPRQYKNHTDAGYKIERVPTAVWESLHSFYEQHRHSVSELEKSSNVMVFNMWEHNVSLVNIRDKSLTGSVAASEAAENFLIPLVEQWVGKNVTSTGQFGVRVYGRGAVVKPHVDFYPRIFTALMVISADIDEPWPLEIRNKHRHFHIFNLQAGDVLLYEGHNLPHRRVGALRGNHYAIFFEQFKPVPVMKAIHQRKHGPESAMYFSGPSQSTPQQQSETDAGEGSGSRSSAAFLEKRNPPPPSPDPVPDPVPVPVPRGAETQRYSSGSGRLASMMGRTALHISASEGDLALVSTLVQFLLQDARGDSSIDGGQALAQINAADSNGWMPIHEAARAGHLEVVRYLVEHGADLGAATHSGDTALSLALSTRRHDVAQYLHRIGAPDAQREL